MQYKIILLGPQGSGKGTQATLLAQALNIPAISMGELLRQRAAKEGADVAEKIATRQKAGDLVDDQIALETLKAHLETLDTTNGYLIDGYPRNQAQANTYLGFDQPTDMIVLEIPREESMRRLVKRAEIEHRNDDEAAIIEHRLDVYDQETKPLLEQFAKLGSLRVIKGTGTIEEVHAAIMENFKK